MGTIEQLTIAKIIGVFVHCGFKCDNHVDLSLSVCSQRVYLLKLLPDWGLKRHLYPITLVYMSNAFAVLLGRGERALYKFP